MAKQHNNKPDLDIFNLDDNYLTEKIDEFAAVILGRHFNKQYGSERDDSLIKDASMVLLAPINIAISSTLLAATNIVFASYMGLGGLLHPNRKESHRYQAQFFIHCCSALLCVAVMVCGLLSPFTRMINILSRLSATPTDAQTDKSKSHPTISKESLKQIKDQAKTSTPETSDTSDTSDTSSDNNENKP